MTILIPPFYKDLTKIPKDILTDDFSLKRQLKIKHTTPQGVGVTVENEHKKGVVSGKITTKYAHKQSGFSLDKLILAPDGGKKIECGLLGLAPGLKLTADVDDKIIGDVGIEYVRPNLAVKSSMDVEVRKFNASATVAYQGVNAGGIVSLNLPDSGKSVQFTDYNAGITWGTIGWFAALTTSDHMRKFNATACYAPSGTVTGVAVASVTPEKSTQEVTVGVKYLCNPRTTLKAKATSDGLLSAAVAHKLSPTVILGAASEVHSSDMQPKFGFNVTLG